MTEPRLAGILPGSLWRDRRGHEFTVLTVANGDFEGLPRIVVASDSVGCVLAQRVTMWLALLTPTGETVEAVGIAPVVGLLPLAVIGVLAERADAQARGFTDQVDDAHADTVLPGAALNYLYSAMEQLAGGPPSGEPTFASAWPHLHDGAPWRWKPRGPVEDLRRAAALVMAQLEKLDREARRGRLTDTGGAVTVGA